MTPRSLSLLPPLWRESRIGLEAAALLRHPIHRGEGVAHADGQPVMLIPGFLAGDDSLGIMTRWLRRTGHHTSKAGMRSNVDCSAAAFARLEERLEVMAESRGAKVAIIGQSRGGNFAKVLARRRPDLVSGIVTLGSPQKNPTAIHPLVRAQVYAVGALGTLGVKGLFQHSCLWGDCCKTFWEDLRGELPPEVGYVSVYSRTDGVVDWRACLDEGARHVEVRASHCGMAVNVGTYEALAEALAEFRERGQGRVQRRASGTARKATAKKAAAPKRAATPKRAGDLRRAA
ncbi:MAG: triacylglycerol lipase [Thermoleophilaceae bacterium]|jgi:pimeloyl-ACP methyl ester carboxylesterase|nr:triacylglycerol lipase [Thermoleophilaceae bacterium]